MAIYRVSGSATVSCFTEVEADNETEAIKIAQERELGGLCYHPFSGDIDECFHFENDGMPLDLTAEIMNKN